MIGRENTATYRRMRTSLHSRIYAVFHKKFGWVRADPWKEGEAPFIRIKPWWKVSWGLGSFIAVLGANRKLFLHSLCTRIYMPKLFSGYA